MNGKVADIFKQIQRILFNKNLNSSIYVIIFVFFILECVKVKDVHMPLNTFGPTIDLLSQDSITKEDYNCK